MIYPGKVTDTETFRIGKIGHVFPEDIDDLIRNVSEVVDEMGIELTPAFAEPHS
jgi:2-aminoethylphosphonate-pyruvate transaminase